MSGHLPGAQLFSWHFLISDDRAMKPLGSNTVFHVTDIERSIAFYTGALGFQLDFRFGEPTTYAGLSLGPVCLHISAFYPYKDNTGHGNLYISFDEVDSLYQQLAAAGVDFYCPIDDRDYGMRDFSVRDPDGNQIGIGAELSRQP